MLRVEDFVFGAAAYRTAEAIVVESALEAELVAEFAPRERIHIIPPGIDNARWSAADDAPRPERVPERYLLYVGRLASNKGLPGLLEAIARLAPADRAPLVLMGPDWGMRAELESRARRLGLSDQLVWLDRVDDERAYRSVVRGAEALVLPSEWEAYGLVLLDALAAGTPVVATAVGGVPELLDGGRCGRLVPYGDPSALADALQGVRSDRATTERLRRAGTERARSLDWSESVRRHRALYAAAVRA